MAKVEKFYAIVVDADTDSSGNITDVVLSNQYGVEKKITFDIFKQAIEIGAMSVLNYSPSKNMFTDNWKDKEYYTRILNQQIANDKVIRNRTQSKKYEETDVIKEDTDVIKEDTKPIENTTIYRSSDRAILGETELEEVKMQVADYDELYFIGETNASSFKANLTKQNLEVETVSREEINIPSIHIYRVLKEKTKEYYKYALYVVSKHTIEFPHLDTAFIQFNIGGISFKNCNVTSDSMRGTFKNMSFDFLDISGLSIGENVLIEGTFDNISGFEDSQSGVHNRTLVTLGGNKKLVDNGAFDKAFVSYTDA